MDDYYFDGDPAVDSTRRHMERVLQGRSPRRWPWVVAGLAGGAAFTWWRIRVHRAAPRQAEGEAAMPVGHARAEGG